MALHCQSDPRLLEEPEPPNIIAGDGSFNAPNVSVKVLWANHRNIIIKRSNAGLGLLISGMRSPWNAESATITGFRRQEELLGPAEASGMIKVGDIICGVSGRSVEMATFKETVECISKAPCEVCLDIFRFDNRPPLTKAFSPVAVIAPRLIPPWDRPEGIPIVEGHQQSKEGLEKWLDARKQLWKAIGCRNERPWPSWNPEFVPIEASEDSDELSWIPEAPRPIPEWDRPSGVPIVENIGNEPEEVMRWLRARQCLWKAVSCRNGHPWPSQNPNFEEIDEDGDEEVELTPEWLLWLQLRKDHWKELSLKRQLKRKAEEVKEQVRKEAIKDHWVFNCCCRLMDEEGYDDGTAQWQCPRCHKWGHIKCIRAWYRATYRRRLSLSHYTECFACCVSRSYEEGVSLPILPPDLVREDEVEIEEIAESSSISNMRTRGGKKRSLNKKTKLSQSKDLSRCSLKPKAMNTFPLSTPLSSLTSQNVELLIHNETQCRLLADDFNDDSLAACFEFLPKETPLVLLLVSMRWRNKLKKRDDLWQILCLHQEQWKSRLPSRARKPWCEIFIQELTREHKARLLASDDLLRKCWILLRKGDNVVAVKKLVEEGEEKFGFSVNHSSGVMFEANPLLNLAILQKRSKVAKWLIISKQAALNLCDKGGFTALMDAAWDGDLPLTKLLLQFGSDPSLKGQSHFSGGIKVHGPSLDASSWASSKGHTEVADLIAQWRDASPEHVAAVRARAVEEISTTYS